MFRPPSNQNFRPAPGSPMSASAASLFGQGVNTGGHAHDNFFGSSNFSSLPPMQNHVNTSPVPHSPSMPPKIPSGPPSLDSKSSTGNPFSRGSNRQRGYRTPGPPSGQLTTQPMIPSSQHTTQAIVSSGQQAAQPMVPMASTIQPAAIFAPPPVDGKQATGEAANFFTPQEMAPQQNYFDTMQNQPQIMNIDQNQPQIMNIDQNRMKESFSSVDMKLIESLCQFENDPDENPDDSKEPWKFNCVGKSFQQYPSVSHSHEKKQQMEEEHQKVLNEKLLNRDSNIQKVQQKKEDMIAQQKAQWAHMEEQKRIGESFSSSNEPFSLQQKPSSKEDRRALRKRAEKIRQKKALQKSQHDAGSLEGLINDMSSRGTSLCSDLSDTNALSEDMSSLSPAVLPPSNMSTQELDNRTDNMYPTHPQDHSVNHYPDSFFPHQAQTNQILPTETLEGTRASSEESSATTGSTSMSSFGIVSVNSSESESRLSPYQIVDSVNTVGSSSADISPIDMQNVSSSSASYEKVSKPTTSTSNILPNVQNANMVGSFTTSNVYSSHDRNDLISRTNEVQAKASTFFQAAMQEKPISSLVINNPLVVNEHSNNEMKGTLTNDKSSSTNQIFSNSSSSSLSFHQEHYANTDESNNFVQPQNFKDSSPEYQQNNNMQNINISPFVSDDTLPQSEHTQRTNNETIYQNALQTDPISQPYKNENLETCNQESLYFTPQETQSSVPVTENVHGNDELSSFSNISLESNHPPHNQFIPEFVDEKTKQQPAFADDSRQPFQQQISNTDMFFNSTNTDTISNFSNPQMSSPYVSENSETVSEVVDSNQQAPITELNTMGSNQQQLLRNEIISNPADSEFQQPVNANVMQQTNLIPDMFERKNSGNIYVNDKQSVLSTDRHEIPQDIPVVNQQLIAQTSKAVNETPQNVSLATQQVITQANTAAYTAPQNILAVNQQPVSHSNAVPYESSQNIPVFSKQQNAILSTRVHQTPQNIHSVSQVPNTQTNMTTKQTTPIIPTSSVPPNAQTNMAAFETPQTISAFTQQMTLQPSEQSSRADNPRSQINPMGNNQQNFQPNMADKQTVQNISAFTQHPSEQASMPAYVITQNIPIDKQPEIQPNNEVRQITQNMPVDGQQLSAKPNVPPYQKSQTSSVTQQPSVHHNVTGFHTPQNIPVNSQQQNTQSNMASYHQTPLNMPAKSEQAHISSINHQQSVQHNRAAFETPQNTPGVNQQPRSHSNVVPQSNATTYPTQQNVPVVNQQYSSRSHDVQHSNLTAYQTPQSIPAVNQTSHPHSSSTGFQPLENQTQNVQQPQSNKVVNDQFNIRRNETPDMYSSPAPLSNQEYTSNTDNRSMSSMEQDKQEGQSFSSLGSINESYVNNSLTQHLQQQGHHQMPHQQQGYHQMIPPQQQSYSQPMQPQDAASMYPPYMQQNNPYTGYQQNAYNQYNPEYSAWYDQWYQYQQYYSGYGGYYPPWQNPWAGYDSYSYTSSAASSTYGDNSRPASVVERRSTSSENVLSELGDLTSELSFSKRPVTPPPEEIMQRTTPLSFTRPHMRAIFGRNGGVINIVPPKQPLDGEVATIESIKLESMLPIHNLKRFPGPLIRGDTSKKKVLNFIHDTINNVLPRNYSEDKMFALRALWEFVDLLVRQNGTFVGSDVAEMLLHMLPTYQTDDGVDTKNLISSINMPRSMSQHEIEEFQLLVVSGRLKDALDHSITCENWGQAFMLANCMGEKYATLVQTRFFQALKSSDPVKTLYSHMINKDNSFIKKCTNSKDWVQHFCVLASHSCGNKAKDVEKLIEFGDSLKCNGALEASHLAYLVAESASHIHLIGVDHEAFSGKRISVFNDALSVQLTEIYQYAKRLHNPTFTIPQFQKHLFHYALEIMEYGYPHQALAYFESISLSINVDSTNCLYERQFCYSVSQFSHQLLLQDVEEYNEKETPPWLLALDTYISKIPNDGQSRRIMSEGELRSSVMSEGELRSSVDQTKEVIPSTERRSDQHIDDTGIKQLTNIANQNEQNNRFSVDETQSYATPHDHVDGPSHNPSDGAPHNVDGPGLISNSFENSHAHDHSSRKHSSYGTLSDAQTEDFHNTFGEQKQQVPTFFQPTKYPSHDATPDVSTSRSGVTNESSSDFDLSQSQQSYAFYEPPQQTLEYQSQHSFEYQSQMNRMDAGLQSNQQDQYGSQTNQQQQQEYVEEEMAEEDLFGGFTKKKPDDSNIQSANAKSANDKTKSSSVGKEKQPSNTPTKKGWFGGILSKFTGSKEVYLPDDKDKSLYFDKTLGRWVDKNADEEEIKAPPPPPPTGSFGKTPVAPVVQQPLQTSHLQTSQTPQVSNPALSNSSLPFVPNLATPNHVSAPNQESSNSTGNFPSTQTNTQEMAHFNNSFPQSSESSFNSVPDSNNSQSTTLPSNDATNSATETPAAMRRRMRREQQRTLLEMSKAKANAANEKDKEKPAGPPSRFSLRASGSNARRGRYVNVMGGNSGAAMKPISDPMSGKTSSAPAQMSFFNPGAMSPSTQ